MGYEQAIEKAGATVHCFEHFGSYQGEWWAKVTNQGKTGWISGYYGSCSGCDAYEAEFGYEDTDDAKLAAFGIEYLEDIKTQEEAEKSASQNISWDHEAEEMVAFIKKNA